MFLVNIVIVLLLVGANAFFVATEFSLVAVRPTRIHQLREGGSLRARTAEALLRDLDRVLSGVQLGITMASLLLGWLGELMLASQLVPLFESLGVPWAVPMAHTVAVTIAFLIITTLHVVLGELVPKSMALQRAERVALLVAPPMQVFMLAFGPLIRLFDSASNTVLRALGFHAGVGHALVRSAEELRVLLGQVEEHGVLKMEQARMLEGALQLGVVEVRQVMVPRSAIVAIPAHASLEEALEIIRRHGRSRYPVYETTPEQIIGLLHAKDLFQHLRERLERAERGGPLPSFDLRRFLREAHFVPESKPLAELLEDFRRKRVPIAMVVDEYGSVQGMVTLDDILETIVGEVRDEYEPPDAAQKVAEGGWVVDARTPLLDLEHQHRFELPPGPGFETLAGFVLSRLGFIPQGGESFLHDSYRFTVLEMDGRRIARVKIEPVAANDAAADGTAATSAAAPRADL